MGAGILRVRSHRLPEDGEGLFVLEVIGVIRRLRAQCLRRRVSLRGCGQKREEDATEDGNSAPPAGH